MQHAAIALMAHYRMCSRYAYAQDQAQIETDLLSVVDPEFTPEVLEIVQANLRSNYDVIDGPSTQQAVQALLQDAQPRASFTPKDKALLQSNPSLAQLAELADTAETAGFQYSRAVETISRAVSCGYLDEADALQWLDTIGQAVSQRFASWTQFWASSMLGKWLMTHRFNPESDMILSVEDYVKDLLLLLLSPAQPLQHLSLLPLGDNAPLQAALQALLPEPFDMQAFSNSAAISPEGMYEILVWPALQKYGLTELLVDNPLLRMNFVSDGDFHFHNAVNATKLFVNNEYTEEIPLIVLSNGLLTTRGLYYRQKKMVFFGDDHFVPWEGGLRFTVKVPWDQGSLNVYFNDIKVGSCTLRDQDFPSEKAERAFVEKARQSLEDFLNNFATSTTSWR